MAKWWKLFYLLSQMPEPAAPDLAKFRLHLLRVTIEHLCPRPHAHIYKLLQSESLD
jgi:hypothetical protein